MNIIFKLFKELNSATSEKMLTLAIIFAMFSGFLPSTSVISVLILIIVFILNIPIGIYLIVTALFASLAFILDPVFSSIGFSILQIQGLHGIFSSMFDNTLLLWTDFNYTTTMGSLIVALLASIPLYFILNKTFVKYKQNMQEKFENSKYFSWLNPYREDKVEAKKGLIRISGVLIISAVLGFFVFVITMFFDPFIKYVLQKGVNKNTDYQIQIDTLNTKWASGDINLAGIIVNKENQTTKIDNIIIQFNSNKALQKQLHIKLIEFKNIQPDSKPVAIKEQRNINLPSFDNIATIKNIDFNKNIQNISANKTKEYIESLNKAIEKVKPYMKKSKDKQQVLQQRTIGQYISFAKDNTPLFEIARIKGTGTIKKDKLPLHKKISLDKSIIDFAFDANTKNIDSISTKIKSDFKDVNIKYISSNKNEKIIADVLDTVKTFYINSELNFALENADIVKIKIKTNLDKILKKQLQNKLKGEIKNKVKDKIKDKIGDKVGEKAGGLLKGLF